MRGAAASDVGKWPKKHSWSVEKSPIEGLVWTLFGKEWPSLRSRFASLKTLSRYGFGSYLSLSMTLLPWMGRGLLKYASSTLFSSRSLIAHTTLVLEITFVFLSSLMRGKAHPFDTSGLREEWLFASSCCFDDSVRLLMAKDSRIAWSLAFWCARDPLFPASAI